MLYWWWRSGSVRELTRIKMFITVIYSRSSSYGQFPLALASCKSIIEAEHASSYNYSYTCDIGLNCQ